MIIQEHIGKCERLDVNGTIVSGFSCTKNFIEGFPSNAVNSKNKMTKKIK